MNPRTRRHRRRTQINPGQRHTIRTSGMPEEQLLHGLRAAADVAPHQIGVIAL
jgi:hypothetical protein